MSIKTSRSGKRTERESHWLGTILAKTLPDALWRQHRVAIALPGMSSLYGSAVTRRLDRLSKQNEQLDFQIEVANEALALFVRFWLTANPQIPVSARAAASAGQRALRRLYRGTGAEAGIGLASGRRFAQREALNNHGGFAGQDFHTSL
ncbi:MAG: hypothetical protein ACOYLK_14080 [Sphingomonas sp.]|jgi:hypothetical protein